MDSLFFHPKVVHLPIALGVLMPLIAAVVALAWWRGWLPARTWALVVGLQAVLLISGFAAIRTGSAQEEHVERVVAGRYIHEHEEAAEGFVWGMGVVLALMLVALLTSRKRAGLPLAALSVLGTVVVLGLAYRTGDRGGRLVYEHGAAQVYMQAEAQADHHVDEAEEPDHDE
jgi:uncharacterized membrane protein